MGRAGHGCMHTEANGVYGNNQAKLVNLLFQFGVGDASKQ